MQETIIGDQEQIGKINRKPHVSELLELMIIARETHDKLHWLKGGIESWGLTDLPLFENPDDTLDEAGYLCATVEDYCRDELKKLDYPRKKKE